MKTATRKSFKFLRRWQIWQLMYIAASLSWLLAPSLDHRLSSRATLISQFEGAGQPWAWLFRIFDILAGLLLAFAVYKAVKGTRKPNWQLRTTLILLGVVAAGSIIDDMFPSFCHSPAVFSCIVPSHLSRSIHLGESVITAAAFFLLNCWYVYLRKPWARYVLAMQLAWVIFVCIFDTRSRYISATLLQFSYEVVIVLWIAAIVPALESTKSTLKSMAENTVVRFFGSWLFASGLLSIVTAITHVREAGKFSAIYLGDATAWTAQHGIVTGIVLMYISRHLWRGEFRAWQIASALLWLQTLKYAVLTPSYLLVCVFGISAVALFVMRPYFDRSTSVERLADQLKKLALVVATTIAALIIGIAIVEFSRHHSIAAARLHLTTLFRHLLLIDIDNNSGPLRFKLFGQAINIAGFTLLLAILVSLFKPYAVRSANATMEDKARVLRLLGSHSTSSEDYFKYWPDKTYWHSSNGAIITFRVVGNVAFALADPIADSTESRQAAAEEFLAYCRRHGWRACFLMVTGNARDLYANTGYKLFRIGASALVDIRQFNGTTSQGKWWRWVHNKAARQNLHYQLQVPPHAPELLAQLQAVSDEWLQVGGHQEHGFAMGYFNKAYLQECRLHTLRKDDTIVAFANELPVYNGLPTATIDLMRYRPQESHAMPVLLAATIKQLGSEADGKSKFDLGFVPLAAPSGKAERAASKLGQLLMGETMSARGLEQFKNKFAPDWQDDFIAFDGDWADLLHIGRYLGKLLKA
ncbi:MAG TPA: phosphatidylglycerol lysyltransferase domain-containing protein [Candidatus Saccharimonadales bacterium]